MKFVFILSIVAALPVIHQEQPIKRPWDAIDSIPETRNVLPKLANEDLNAHTFSDLPGLSSNSFEDVGKGERSLGLNSEHIIRSLDNFNFDDISAVPDTTDTQIDSRKPDVLDHTLEYHAAEELLSTYQGNGMHKQSMRENITGQRDSDSKDTNSGYNAALHLC